MYYVIKKYIYKYKYFLTILLLFTFFIVFFNKPFREGLVGMTNQYQYLAPDPSGNSWDQDTINQFMNKYNSINDLSGNNALDSSDFQPNSFWFNNALEEEAQYYIQNGNWPYCSYVTKNLIPSIQKLYPNRVVYAVGIGMSEEKQSPQPMSYQIFSGTKPDPSSSSNNSSTISKLHNTNATSKVSTGTNSGSTSKKIGLS